MYSLSLISHRVSINSGGGSFEPKATLSKLFKREIWGRMRCHTNKQHRRVMTIFFLVWESDNKSELVVKPLVFDK